MTDKHITVDTVRWHSVLPWLHLLRAIQLALRVRMVLIALLGLAAFQAGIQLLESWQVNTSSLRGGQVWPTISESLPRGFKMIWIDEMLPWTTVITPASQLFERNNSWTTVASAWTLLLLALLIWAIVGGAMTRIAAVRFARDESVPRCAALRFSVRNWQSYLYGPLLPMLAVGLFASLSGGVGWLHRWWGAGGVMNYLGFIPLFCGLAIGLLLVLMAVSWPLMVAAISTEGSDGFDGLSRAFGYVMNRPWYFAFLVCLTHFVGWVMNALVHGIAAIAWKMAEWSSDVSRQPDFGVWSGLSGMIVSAVFVSFFWSATTVIYFLLRQADDGTPLDQVYIPGPPPVPEPLPLVGVAASEQPVIERPAT